MNVFNKILCPVDFSSLSQAALRHAHLLAGRLGSKVTVLHAHTVDLPPYFTGSQWESLERQLKEALTAAAGALRDFTRQTLGAVPETYDFLTVDQPARRAILDAAPRFDLIVMGTHGRSGINRFLLGSVAERVLREASVPVLTVRSAPPEGPLPLRHILVAVNETKGARHALGLAAKLATALDAALTLLHVPEPEETATVKDFCAWVPEEEQKTCHIQTVERHGNPAEEILKAARDLDADLIVIGGQHKRFADSTVLGATFTRVVRHAPVPVLSSVLPEA